MRCTPEGIQESQLFLAETEGLLMAQMAAVSAKLTAPGFQAGGVIVKLEQDAFLNDRAMIVTSKNNLLRLANWDHKNALPDFTDYAIKPLLGDFIEKVAIHYGDGQKAPIDNIAVVESNWSDDLLLLLSLDQELVEYTRQHGIMGSLGRIQKHRQYYTGGLALPFRHMQAGLGWDAQSAGTPGESPAYRLVNLNQELPGKVKAAGVEEGNYKAVLQFSADNDNTLTEGDQGCGLFAAFSQKDELPELLLYGVNLGTNFYPDILGTSTTVANNAATCVRAVIERTYIQLDHGRKVEAPSV